MQTVHFIAIGGTGMSGIARILLDRGYRVTGSDLHANNLTKSLEEHGAEVHIGHRAENLGNPDMVVVSSAIHDENPEISLARQRGISVIHRMDALLFAVEGKRLLAVAGSHGKTTTTSMIAWTLLKAGADPTYLVGGEFGLGGNARIGQGEYAVFETDESDGSFLKVSPDIGLATNVDNDHLDYWGSVSALQEAFSKYLCGVRKGGTRIVCADNEYLRGYAEANPGSVTYSMGKDSLWRAPDFQSKGWGSVSRVFHEGKEVAEMNLSVPGKHNAQNALGAMAAAYSAGISPEAASSHLSSFTGAKRRLERIGEFSGVLVVDDFAHHPRKIAAALTAIRATLPGHKITAIFQPHRYSRTRLLKDEFGDALMLADRVFVTGIYAGPGEEPEEGVSSALVTDSLRALGHRDASLMENKEEAARRAAGLSRPGDVIVTIGAGDVWETHSIIEDELTRSRQ